MYQRASVGRWQHQGAAEAAAKDDRASEGQRRAAGRAEPGREVQPSPSVPQQFHSHLVPHAAATQPHGQPKQAPES